jgi:hypothetical protein
MWALKERKKEIQSPSSGCEIFGSTEQKMGNN